MTVRLAKLHATGNDFLVIDRLAGPGAGSGDDVPPSLVVALCDRHRGVGAEGVIVVSRSDDGADCRMRLRNADGHPAEMSGNGVRCVAWVMVRAGFTGSTLSIDTDAGRRSVDVERGPDGDVVEATVDMGAVTFDPAAIPLDAASPFDLEATVHGVAYRGDAAGMGNPHYVLLVDDVDAARVVQHGPRLEHDPRFPNRTNVEFVQPVDRGLVRMRVWERGVGETLSCGTGACAAAAVARRRGLVGADVAVEVPGGRLRVALGETVRLGGPVVHVFDVDIDADADRWRAGEGEARPQ